MRYHGSYMEPYETPESEPAAEAAPPADAPARGPKPLPILIAVLILLIAGVAAWYLLTRPVPEGPLGGAATTTPSGEPGAKAIIRDSGQYHEITAAYPSATPLSASAGASANARAVALMKSFAEQEAARFEDANVSELSAEDIEIQGLGGDRKYVLDADYDAYESPVTVSYVYRMYADTLGAHPNAYYRTFTFDKASGEALILEDLFATGDFLDVLSNETRKRLKAQIAEASDVPEDELDLSMIEAGTTPYADNFQNFYLEGADLVIVFPPYQVGPWAIGTQEVRLERTSLGNTLKARYR